MDIRFAHRIALKLLIVMSLDVLAGRHAQATTVEYIHTDALGSPVAVTNAAGVVIERTEYAPYGEQLNRAEDDGPGYTGHVTDKTTGLNYMQQRYYDPGIGRFLSIDPVTPAAKDGANFNRYKYASNNPYRFTDPDGRCDNSFCEFFGLQGAPESIRDKTYDMADTARGRDGQYLVGGYVATGGVAVAGVGGIALVESGVAASALTTVSNSAATANAAVGIGLLKTGQTLSNQAGQAATWASNQATQGYTSLMTSSFVSSGGSFSFLGMQMNATQASQGVLNAVSETATGSPPNQSGIVATLSTKAVMGVLEKMNSPPPDPDDQKK